MFQLIRGFVLPAAACDGNRDGDSRYANLFRKLDLNEDGRVDIAELQTGLRAMGIPLGKEAEEALFIEILYLKWTSAKMAVSAFLLQGSLVLRTKNRKVKLCS